MARIPTGHVVGVVLAGAGLAVGLGRSAGWIGGPKAVVVYHAASEHGCFSAPRPSLSDYKRVQAALVTDRRTLEAALADPAVRGLSVVPADGAVDWLAGRLKVDVQGTSGLFSVSIRGYKADEYLTLLGAVDRAYRAASHARDNAPRRDRRAKLEKEYPEAQAGLKELQDRLDAVNAKCPYVVSVNFMVTLREAQRESVAAKLAVLRDELRAARGNPADCDRIAGKINTYEATFNHLMEEVVRWKLFRDDLENLAREVEAREVIVRRLAGELEAMRIEGDAAPRVTVAEEPRIVRWAD
ncbi:MAG: hypothetical protein C0501_08405 [Isosphaera sp.]|nr:hypothetical protein [Isosphaera sp.]